MLLLTNEISHLICPNAGHELLHHVLCLQLEEGHTGRLERTEDLWLRVRKDHAPRLARLSLESRSLRDVLLHGESPPNSSVVPTNGHSALTRFC